MQQRRDVEAIAQPRADGYCLDLAHAAHAAHVVQAGRVAQAVDVAQVARHIEAA